MPPANPVLSVVACWAMSPQSERPTILAADASSSATWSAANRRSSTPSTTPASCGPGFSCEDQARLFTATLLGLWILLRAGAPRPVLLSAARAARENLDRLRV